MMRDTSGAEQEAKEATTTMETAAGGRRRTTEDPPVSRKHNFAGGKDRVGGNGTEESAEESTKGSGE